ncbi:hypothetical protein MAIT1_02676 [Magnetofaba australis IT-1]|uniref:Uncharacterized protein n=2 Tax=Magnetofaba TaxID=1472292 RepID=A0A1Y2K3M3_9PROT|nr:hypothetical protein MAIT1_02676 [Magnetofaba australis IT-1]
MQKAARYAQMATLAQQLRHVLMRVPHGHGDHSDRCRMANDGLAPSAPDQCQCHVAEIRAVLAQSSMLTEPEKER